MKPREIIALAESKVRVETVLEDLYELDIPRDAGDWKCQCPLGYEHSDGGRAKAMRVYSDSNTTWCFSHSAKYTPVVLWQMKFGIQSRTQAARELLSHYGISTEPPTLDERWDKLDEIPPEDLLDREVLKETFLTHLRSLPGYAIIQYEADTLDLVSSILRTADRLPDDASYATLEDWLRTSNNIMRKYWRKYEHH